MNDPMLRGFPPVVGDRPRVLVLGSFPGVESLRQGEYYAHPRNQFWPIVGELVGAGPWLDYGARRSRLIEAGIALWDVLDVCKRRGSLDQRIERGSERPNDLAGLIATHPTLACCCLNGGAAGRLLARSADSLGFGLPRLVLPSTSPAHARMSLADKLEAWRAALAPYLDASCRRAKAAEVARTIASARPQPCSSRR